MFSNYRKILEKIATTDEEHEVQGFTDLIEDIRTMKDQDGVSEQVKILLEPVCDIIEEEKDPEHVQKILGAMIRIDRLIEEKKDNRKPVPKSQKTIEETLPKKESIQFIGKPETIPKKKTNDDYSEYEYDQDQVLAKYGTVSILSPIVKRLDEELPETFNTKDLKDALFKLFKESKRDISKQSVRVYASKYKKYLEEHELIEDLTKGPANTQHTYKKKVSTDRNKNIESYILNWGKAHENEVRPMGVLVSAKLEDDMKLSLDEINKAIERLVEKDKLSKQVIERERGSKLTSYVLQ